jgi:AP-1-like factor
MTTTNGQFMSYLDSNQQDLLAAALNSNNPNQLQSASSMGQQLGNDQSQFSFEGMDPTLFMNTNNLAMPNFDANFGSIDNSPFLDYADNDGNLDFEYDADGQMIGGFPGEEQDDDDDDDDDNDHHDLHDKRKSPGDDREDNENGGKRREGEVKEAKKPGRKPLTSEPTNVSRCDAYTLIEPMLAFNVSHRELQLNVGQKRKAQNRAAQRAFRERKEKHLKDLETKVGELEKASESANHENGLLRAQVDRLQIELREYRKRLSMNSGLTGRAPPVGGNMFLPSAANGSSTNNFQFEFPKFGSLPGGVFGNGNGNKKVLPNASTKAVPGVLARNGSTGRSVSPGSQARANGSISSGASPHVNGSFSSNAGTPEQSSNSVSSIFTPAGFDGLSGGSALGFDNWVTTTTSAEPESTANGQANPSRIFQFNSSNATSTASPGSSSSLSQYGGGPNSSCGTSPEPSHNSPKNNNLDTITECHTIQTSDGEISFCDQLNMACGNIRNPIPRTKSQQSDGTKTTGANMEANTTVNARNNANFNTKDPDFNTFFATMADQNGGGFDPQLFDTYREPHAAIVGDGDFTGGFFNDAMPAGNFGTPFDWANITAPTGLTPFATNKSNPLEVADALQAGVDEDEVVPGDAPNSMLTCHKIW